MTAGPRVSVCLPTYNGASFVEEAMRSVLAQDEDLELLVVDDGSTDATVEIARSIADRRARVIEAEEHLGIPGSWNRGVELASGEFVCVFHQDDVMLPGNLSYKVRALAGDPAMSFVHSAIEVLVKPPATEPPAWVENADHDFVAEGEAYFRRLLFGGNRICAPAVVARRDRVLAAGGFDEDLGYAPDYELWMKLCLWGRVAFLARPSLRYRWHDQNESHSFRFERGVEEVSLARARAVEHFVLRGGRRSEAEVMIEGVAALAERERWTADLHRLSEERRRSIAQLEHRQAELEGDLAAWQSKAAEELRLNAEQSRWIAELEEGQASLEGDRAFWQQTAVEQQRLNAEQARWIADLDRTRNRLQRDRERWKRAVDESLVVNEKQASWIAELDRARTWLEDQRAAWQRTAERMQCDYAAVNRELESVRATVTWRLRNRIFRLPGIAASYRRVRSWLRSGRP